MRKAISLVIVLLLVVGSAWAARTTSKSNTVRKSAGLSKPRAVKAKTVKKKKKSRFRRIRWNPVIRGSRESMVRQNEEIDRLQLPRLRDDYDLEQQILLQQLVRIEESPALRVADNLPEDRRFCKPWTMEFLDDLSRDFYRQFRKPIQVNSAIRTAEFQRTLRRRNRNAAPEDGELASSHLAGLTVDISKRGLTRKEKKWLDGYLKNLYDQGLIDGAEERRQPVYHIMVSERYSAFREVQMADGERVAQDD